jgi:hypothetical protein
MSSKSKKSKAPAKRVETTNDESGAPLAPSAPPKIDTGAPTNVTGAVLATLAQKRDDTAQQTTGRAEYVLAPPGAGADVLGGRIGASTHAISVVMCEAAQSATNDDFKLLKTNAVHARHVALCEARSWAPRKLSAMAPHMTRFIERRHVVRVNGSYALSNLGRKLVKLAPLSALTAHEVQQYGAPTVE